MQSISCRGGGCHYSALCRGRGVARIQHGPTYTDDVLMPYNRAAPGPQIEIGISRISTNSPRLLGSMRSENSIGEG